MGALIPVILTLLQTIVPALGSSSAIAAVVNALIQIVPLLIKEYQDVLPMIKNIIAALRSNPETTAELVAQLTVLDAQVDTAFDAAVAKAEAEDAAIAAITALNPSVTTLK